MDAKTVQVHKHPQIIQTALEGEQGIFDPLQMKQGPAQVSLARKSLYKAEPREESPAFQISRWGEGVHLGTGQKFGPTDMREQLLVHIIRQNMKQLCPKFETELLQYRNGKGPRMNWMREQERRREAINLDIHNDLSMTNWQDVLTN